MSTVIVWIPDAAIFARPSFSLNAVAAIITLAFVVLIARPTLVCHCDVTWQIYPSNACFVYDLFFCVARRRALAWPGLLRVLCVKSPFP